MARRAGILILIGVLLSGGGCASSGGRFTLRSLAFWAQGRHRTMVDNAYVRLVEIKIPPGGSVWLDQGEWPGVFVTVSPATLNIRDGSGAWVRRIARDPDARGSLNLGWRGASFGGGRLVNVDTVAYRAFRIEFKSREGASRAALWVWLRSLGIGT